MCVRLFTIIAGLLVFVGPSCSNSDLVKMLLETLKLEHRSACDDQTVSLACPNTTVISIVEAQYSDSPPEGHECEALVDRSCKLSNKLQWILLQRVVLKCQMKPSCIFNTNPDEVDLCSSYKKFVEVSYKCRPLDFRNLHACSNKVVHLNCNAYSRIVIYDAKFGRNTHDDVKCPQPQGVPDENCETQYAAETARRICHGKRKCQLTANTDTFGKTMSCKPYSRPYVKVIYACVPLGVLMERYESNHENDETGDLNNIGINNQGLYNDNAGERWRESNTLPPIPDSAMPSQVETTTVQSSDKNELSQPTNMENESVKKFKLLVYIGLGVIAFVIIALVAVATYCYFTRKAKENAKNGEMFTSEAPNVFNDASSDIDNDVEVSHISGTFYDPVHPDMILYRDIDGTKNTLRAMKPLSTIYPSAGPRMYGTVDYVPPQPREFGHFTRSRSKEEPQPESMTSPKSLGAYSTSQFYYG